jgi:hypothetical protein
MPDSSAQVDIPNRALFKAAEVCDLAKVQPCVLRSWESGFHHWAWRRAPEPRASIAARTWSGCCGSSICCWSKDDARRRARRSTKTAPVAADAPVFDELVGRNARERRRPWRRLQSILDLLARGRGEAEFRRATADPHRV